MKRERPILEPFAQKTKRKRTCSFEYDSFFCFRPAIHNNEKLHSLAVGWISNGPFILHQYHSPHRQIQRLQIVQHTCTMIVKCRKSRFSHQTTVPLTDAINTLRIRKQLAANSLVDFLFIFGLQPRVFPRMEGREDARYSAASLGGRRAPVPTLEQGRRKSASPRRGGESVRV